MASGEDSVPALDAAAVDALNARCSVVKRFHSVVDAMTLGYACRGSPRYFTCRVEAAADGRTLIIYTSEKRLRVSLTDTYFDKALVERLAVGYEGAVELCGILKAGRTQLRVRLPEVVAPARAQMGAYMVQELGRELKKSATLDVGPASPAAPVFKQVGGGRKAAQDTADTVAAGMLQAAGRGDEGGAEEGGEPGVGGAEEEDEGMEQLEAPVENFEEACELASRVMGYPIDDFQVCL